MSVNTSAALRRYRDDIKRLTIPRLIAHGYADLVHVRGAFSDDAARRADARTSAALVACVADELVQRGEESEAVRLRSYRHTARTAPAVQWSLGEKGYHVPTALPPGYDMATGLRKRRTAPKRVRGAR